MFSKLFTVALAASSLFVPLVSAGRFREVAHRKGFSPDLKLKRHEEQAEKLESRWDNFRFLTDATESKSKSINFLCLFRDDTNNCRVQSRLSPRHSF